MLFSSCRALFPQLHTPSACTKRQPDSGTRHGRKHEVGETQTHKRARTRRMAFPTFAGIFLACRWIIRFNYGTEAMKDAARLIRKWTSVQSQGDGVRQRERDSRKQNKKTSRTMSGREQCMWIESNAVKANPTELNYLHLNDPNWKYLL